MRYSIQKKHSTKPERIVYEILKELKIPFRHRWILRGREIDFIFGNVALEIDGHEQDGKRNLDLIEMGYIPIHFSNQEVLNNRENIKAKIKLYESNTSNAT
jgi:very-short-patch-repair endonuclease